MRAEAWLQEKEDKLVQRDSTALDLDQLKATLDSCTCQAVALEQRNELLRSRMTARRHEIEVGQCSFVLWEATLGLLARALIQAGKLQLAGT